MILRDRDMRNRAITVIIIIAIFLLAFFRMNTRFDRLSRYPYQDEHARELINEYLDDDAVNYIIEYAIEPSYFIDLIEAPGFNIYHVEYYRTLEREITYLTKNEIVAFAEETLTYENGQETAMSLLSAYSANEILFWMRNGDPYYPQAELVDVPDSLAVVLNDRNTIANRIPLGLVDVSEAGFEEGIQVRTEMVNDLTHMCDLLSSVYGGSCGGMNIENGYVSYSDLEKAYQAGETAVAPGHNEHQTGLAIDVSFNDVGGSSEDKTAWLLENIEQFGFIRRVYANEPYIHLRYCGKANIDRVKKG